MFCLCLVILSGGAKAARMLQQRGEQSKDSHWDPPSPVWEPWKFSGGRRDRDHCPSQDQIPKKAEAIKGMWIPQADFLKRWDPEHGSAFSFLLQYLPNPLAQLLSIKNKGPINHCVVTSVIKRKRHTKRSTPFSFFLFSIEYLLLLQWLSAF